MPTAAAHTTERWIAAAAYARLSSRMHGDRSGDGGRLGYSEPSRNAPVRGVSGGSGTTYSPVGELAV